MTSSVELLFKARKEIFESWVWFEEQQAGLGDRFEKEVFEQIELIAKNPLHYPLKKGFREANTDKFRFLIVYRFNQRTRAITIVSVFHTSRHPRKKH